MILVLLRVVGYLALLGGAGFLIFRPRFMQRHALPVFLFAVLQFGFPFYFITRIPTGWRDASGVGWQTFLFYFLLCLVAIVARGWIAERVVRLPLRGRRWANHPTSFILLAAMHNAGFIPLPILQRIAPTEVLIGTFFYVFAYNLVFWGVAVPIIQTGRMDAHSFRIRPNAPLVAMAAGFLIALTGAYRVVPPGWLDSAASVADYALDAAIVALGASLAGIRERISLKTEHLLFALGRMVLLPAAVLVAMMIPWSARQPQFGWALKVFLVLQAATPPATQTVVLARAIGQEDQVHFIGETILVTYAVSLATIPLFTALALALFT